MIIGIGNDLIDIRRVAQVIERHGDRFLDRIFTEASLVWVDVILGAIVAAWAMLVLVLVLVGINADDPGLPLLLFLVVVIITVAALLMVVMRALLRQATSLRSEMDTVV